MPKGKKAERDAGGRRAEALALALAELDALRAEVVGRYSVAATAATYEADTAALADLAARLRALRGGPGLG